MYKFAICKYALVTMWVSLQFIDEKSWQFDVVRMATALRTINGRCFK